MNLNDAIHLNKARGWSGRADIRLGREHLKHMNAFLHEIANNTETAVVMDHYIQALESFISVGLTMGWPVEQLWEQHMEFSQTSQRVCNAVKAGFQ
jgi:hypothetical protein